MIGSVLSTLRHVSNLVFVARVAPVVISTAAIGWMFWQPSEPATAQSDVVAQQGSDSNPADSVASDSLFQSQHYLIGWIVFALLWPIVLIPVTRQVVKQERNGFNLIALLATTAVPMALGYPMAFGDSYALWKGLLWVVALAAMFLWSTWIMSRVVEMSK